jgi:hypothetical protein
METKDIVIILLATGVVVFAILYFLKRKPDAFDMSEFTLHDVYKNEEECSATDACGQAFPESKIREIIKMIKKKSRLPFNQIYGYQIELSYIDEMHTAIHSFNCSRKPDELKIAGVRFYESVSTRRINDKDRKKSDLVMIPYLSSKEDIYLVDDPAFAQHKLQMYAYFRPCPKLCGKRRLYIHQKYDVIS